MGQVCSQVDNSTFGSLERITETSTKSQYELAHLEDLPYLLKKVEEITSTISCRSMPIKEFKNFTEGRQLMKHKIKGLYYLGDWSEGGYQYGNGIIYNSDDQYLYYGNFDTVPQGKGVFESISGQYIYQGEFNYGRIEGNGKVSSTSNAFTFDGLFNPKSQPVNGNLIVNHPTDDSKSYKVFLNNYPQNKARIIYKEGREYEGEIRFDSFVPQGQGQARYTNNSYYEGEWDNGEFHRKGKFVWADGSSYEGEYLHSKKHGSGTFVYASKKVYKGAWEHGKQSGFGTLFDQEGKVLKEGTWKEGVLLEIVEE